MSRESHTTALSNITEWIRAVEAARPPHTLRHVTDEALLGLQTLHTATVREIMQRAVDLSEEEQGTNPKRKIAALLQDVHEQLGLGSQWEEALAYHHHHHHHHHHREQDHHHQQQQQKLSSVSSSTCDTKPTMTKAQRKKARKQPVDQKSVEDQERMFEQARMRLEHTHKKE